MKTHVALTGFMAAGKSTIGKKLARKLETAFYDIDDLIVERHGAIADIFASHGELQFRAYELDALDEVLQEPAGVISLGGGAVTYEPTMELLEKRTYRVFVHVPPEEIAMRLRSGARVRPILGPSPSLAAIRELYERRMPLYSEADFVVEAGGLNTTQTVESIAGWLKQKRITL